MAGSSNNGGWNKEQFRILGIDWPPKKGWMFNASGVEITPEQYERFLSLRHVKPKQRKSVDHPALF